MSKGSGAQPYVHSHINHISGGDTISLAESMVSHDTIANSITILEGIRDQLQKEAEKFLMGHGVNEVNAELLKLSDTYAGLAADIIQDRNMIASLLVSSSKGYINKNQLKNTLLKNNSEITDVVIKQIDNLDDKISIEEVAKIISSAWGNENCVLYIGKNGAFVKNFFSFDKSMEQKIAETYTDRMFNSLKKSNRKIVEIVTDLLLKSNLGNTYNKSELPRSVDKFMKTFEGIFMKRVDEIHFWPVDFSPRQYLVNLRDELEAALTKDFTEFRNAAGAINEEILAAVYRADTSVTLQLTATGAKTEEQIIQQFPNLHTMNTHHGESKQSQTDMVIQNKNGMVVRAQSKTSTGEFTIKIENQETERIINHLQRSVNIYTLLCQLNDSGLFPINNIDDICYAIANALWFNTHDSITGVRKTGHFAYSSASDSNILSEVVEALNALLAQQIPSFMGISVNRAVSETAADMAGSNIFYIENGNLVPTYVELNEVIRDLKVYINAVEKTPQVMTFTIENKGKTAWVYDDVQDFWLAKFQHGVYQSEPGIKQGEVAIDSTKIHGTFRALLKFSSYTISSN